MSRHLLVYAPGRIQSCGAVPIVVLVLVLVLV